MKAWKAWVVSIAAFLMLASVSPALAGDEAIRKGVDVWTTVAGFARTSFDEEPIPAGFFCEGSKPFTGTVMFQGAPLATEPAASLGPVDTVVSRLDDAVFDAKGEAYTRIQLLALSLVSTRPIDTTCGAYDVAARLDGEQPTTRMRIQRTSKLGGTYTAPLDLNVKLVFTPVQGNTGARRELPHRVKLGPAAHSVWAYTTWPRYEGTPRIDTNGDGTPDTFLPVASNFLAGVSPIATAANPGPDQPGPPPQPICQFVKQCPVSTCHCNPDPATWDPSDPGTGCNPGHLHCIWVCAICEIDT
jgi:hypothetical protein